MGSHFATFGYSIGINIQKMGKSLHWCRFQYGRPGSLYTRSFRGNQEGHKLSETAAGILYETEPYGYVEQERFINTVFTFETLYHPQELLDFLHGLEQEGNRVREIHWGPRTIDLDILFYGDAVIQEEHLIVPHREIPLREFVLEPLQEIAPFVRHPVNGKTVLQMYEELKKGEKSQ